MTDESPVTTARSSDLTQRIISGIVMLALALGLLWAGGMPFLIGVIILGGVVFFEFGRLVDGFAQTIIGRLCWKGFGLIYVSAAVWALWDLRENHSEAGNGFVTALSAMAIVWAVDIFAYFAGRTLGGPKIWPAISPSKTWSGLLGGIVGASLVFGTVFVTTGDGQFALYMVPFFMLVGTMVAVIAQTGDFFESWMKRRAGVKDSGRLIPGHGGVFDRVDGLLPVVIAAALVLNLLRNAAAG